MNKSEHRIINNRIRRKRQLRRNVTIGLITVLLIISFSSIFFGFRTSAQGSNEKVLYKYYKSIKIEDGDTLWKYAETYSDSRYYDHYSDYIQEVMNINHLSDEEIIASHYLILPYYSEDFH